MRDIVFVFVFVFFAFVMLVIMIFVVNSSKGKINRIYYPMSTKQEICGVYDNVQNKSFLIFKDFTNITNGWCANDCPNIQHRCWCFDEDPRGGAPESCNKGGNKSEKCDYFKGEEKDKYVKFQHYCYPPLKLTKIERHELLKAKYDAASFVTDVKSRGWVVLLSYILAFTFSSVLILLTVRLVKGFVYVFTVIAIIISYVLAVVFVIISIAFFSAQSKIQKSNGLLIMVIGLGLLVVGVITTFVAIRVRSRVSLSVTLLREAGRAVKMLPFLVVIPGVLGLFLVLVYALGQVGMVAHSASGEFYVDDFIRVWHVPKTQFLFIVIALIFIAWLSYFFLGLVQTITASSLASVYFAREFRNIPVSPVYAATVRTLQYGMGTVFMGSFLLFVTLPVRLLLSLLKLRNSWNVAGSNVVTDVLSRMVAAFIPLLQKVSDLYTDSGYVWAALRGDGFHKSCKQALKLKLRNIHRFSAYDKLCNPAFFYLRLIIILLCTFIVSLIIYPLFIGILSYTGTYIKNWFLIIVINFFLITTIVYLVFEVYAFAVEALFVCFSIDEEMLLTYDPKKGADGVVIDSMIPAATAPNMPSSTSDGPLPPNLPPLPDDVAGSSSSSSVDSKSAEEGIGGGGGRAGGGQGVGPGVGPGDAAATTGPSPPYALFASLELAQFMNHLRDIGFNTANLIGFVPPLVVYNKQKGITNLSIIEATKALAVQQQMLVAQQQAQHAGLVVAGVSPAIQNSAPVPPANAYIPSIILSTGNVSITGVTPSDATYKPVNLNNETIPSLSSYGSSSRLPNQPSSSIEGTSADVGVGGGGNASPDLLLSLSSTTGPTDSNAFAQGGQVLYKPNTNL